MKKILVGCLGLLMMATGRGQTFAEWFQQNSTRLKYYGQQIAELQVWLSQLNKGYGIANNGLGAINESKQGEYGLHRAYYSSLEAVNPAVGQLGEVSEIIELQAAIIKRFSDALSRCRVSGHFGAAGLGYIETVYDNVLQAGVADVAVLTDLVTSGNMQLTDDERMKRIMEVDAGMRERYRFTLAFTDRADLLGTQVASQQADIGAVRGIYGIP
ncbi:MAG TPA: hypothetical protein VFE32_21600 [Puia sp.]|jgi:hypothetical protein|nr:hypothetical protein [Puia sp.]